MSVALFLEIKNEYTEHLIDTVSPYIYEGLTCIYKHAEKLAKETNHEEKTLLIFQKLLQSIGDWNQSKIDEETNRIKQLSRTADYLDDLVKAVVKSNIILLSYSNTISNVIAQNFYNTLSTSTFIHRCYTECGKDAHNNPYLFYTDVDPMDYKRNQMIINSKIHSGITKAVRKILPISLILKEYLVNSFNLIQEPAKVELMELSKNSSIKKEKSSINTLSSQKKLEQEVLKMINSENTKNAEKTIKEILNLEKYIGQNNFVNNNNDEEIDIPLSSISKKFVTTPKTSLSSHYLPKMTRNIHDVSEKIDPNNVKFIEEYGDYY